MPTPITVAEFVTDTEEDYHSPITSQFVSHLQHYRDTVANYEEILDADREGLMRMKKAIKAIITSGSAHVENEILLSSALEKIGGTPFGMRDTSYDDMSISAAFSKFSVVNKELSALMKTLMQTLNNIVLFPLDTLLKGDLRGVKGDLKRPFDKACKDYDSKFQKIEKEKKQAAKEVGLYRVEVTGAEVADDMEKERRLFQLQMCDYLIKFNEIKAKKGIDLLQNLVKYYHAQTNYFQDGLKTIEHFGNYVADLSVGLQKIRQQQEEERRSLNELRALIRAAPGIEKEVLVGGGGDRGTLGGYSLHQLQGDKHQGYTRTGYLLKKSEGKMRRVWQKRRCNVKAEGYLEICHADESKPPTQVNLLTCQIKPVLEDKRGFDLISYNRTYHFQAEDEMDQHAWTSVLVNCKERALMKAFDDSSKTGGDKVNHGLIELQQTIIRYIQRIPGNDHCCDCNSQNDATWLSTNFGIIVCIECSGIHRDLGVHISRIQSLTLDNVGTSQLLLARHMTNQIFNDVMEAKLQYNTKPTPSSSMEERFSFIRAKYVDKRYSIKTCNSEQQKLCDLEEAINSVDLMLLLQVFAENVDLSAVLPSSDEGQTALHRAVLRSGGKNLAIVDFLVQNMSSSGIDKQTLPSASYDIPGANTALHYCAMFDKPECMKLLLRGGADPTIRNSQDKTPMAIALEMGHAQCQELLENAANRQKHLFDNINIDWNLSHDDGSTDFSDDDTIIDDRNGSLTPEKKNRSRPPSYTGGGDSPGVLRSRSSTCDSLQSGSSPNSNNRQMPPPPPPQSRKPVTDYGYVASIHGHGSLKKRTAPLPPSGSSAAMYGTLPSSHSRTPSDPVAAGYHTLSHTHKRSPSSDSSSSRSVIYGSKLVMPTDKSGGDKALLAGQVKRPQNPPPPAPSPRLSNGMSSESISSMTSDLDASLNPIPPPRRASDSPPHHKLASSPMSTSPSPRSGHHPVNMHNPDGGGRSSSASGMHTPGGTSISTGVSASSGSRLPFATPPNGGAALRRCTALYNCEADNEDELSFQEGEIIIVINENTEDENWMEGMVANHPERRGMFPISFVHMLPD